MAQPTLTDNAPSPAREASVSDGSPISGQHPRRPLPKESRAGLWFAKRHKSKLYQSGVDVLWKCGLGLLNTEAEIIVAIWLLHDMVWSTGKFILGKTLGKLWTKAGGQGSNKAEVAPRVTQQAESRRAAIDEAKDLPRGERPSVSEIRANNPVGPQPASNQTVQQPMPVRPPEAAHTRPEPASTRSADDFALRSHAARPVVSLASEARSKLAPDASPKQQREALAQLAYERLNVSKDYEYAAALGAYERATGSKVFPEPLSSADAERVRFYAGNIAGTMLDAGIAPSQGADRGSGIQH